jgi:hypothetical protein
LAAKILPVVKPATASTRIVTGAVNIGYFHIFTAVNLVNNDPVDIMVKNHQDILIFSL